jgi:hypothetical protein
MYTIIYSLITELVDNDDESYVQNDHDYVFIIGEKRARTGLQLTGRHFVPYKCSCGRIPSYSGQNHNIVVLTCALTPRAFIFN